MAVARASVADIRPESLAVRAAWAAWRPLPTLAADMTVGRLRERAKRDESDSGDGSGNVSGPGLDPTGSGHSSRRVRGL